MKRKSCSRIVALLMCMVLLLAGCSGGSGKEKKGEETKKKESIHIAISANPPSLDPQSVNSNIVGEIGVHVYEPLFAMNKNY